MAEGVSQTDFLELLDNLVWKTLWCVWTHHFISISKMVSITQMHQISAWGNGSFCQILSQYAPHVSTNTIVLLANCVLLCEQFRQCFIPSAVRYAPLGLKSSYKEYFANSLALDKDKITISIKISWTILTCIAWQFANKEKDTFFQCPWLCFTCIVSAQTRRLLLNTSVVTS